MDFAVRADQRVKISEKKKTGLDINRKLKKIIMNKNKTAEDEDDADKHIVCALAKARKRD